MRLLYIKGLHKEALDLIMDPELVLFFNFASYHILVDFLFEKKYYEDALNVISLMESRGWKSSSITNFLKCGIYYKLNTPEAYKSCLTLMEKILQEREKTPRRMICFAIALALQQDDMEKARTFFDIVDTKETTLCFNLQLLMRSKMGNFDEVLTHLAALALQETGRKFMKRVSSEVLTAVRLLMSNDEVICQRLDHIYQNLVNVKLITHTSLDLLLLSSFPRKSLEPEHIHAQRDRFHNVKAELVAD
uniref:pentatricopeptide repeat-containing protein 2, mitochondrial-like n=1 Tax=Myxine glutinosa TaxID=7769 RepID=UPI003590031E